MNVIQNYPPDMAFIFGFVIFGFFISFHRKRAMILRWRKDRVGSPLNQN